MTTRAETVLAALSDERAGETTVGVEGTSTDR